MIMTTLSGLLVPQVIEVGFNYATFPYELDNAFTERTAAVFFLAGQGSRSLPLRLVTEIAHKHQVPVIVDAAAELPPAANLKRFISDGADLVAFSGGKHIQGPQSSGFLCGKKNLILSASLQQQDMDVFPETWIYRSLIQGGQLVGPPHHGLGRGFKVGKEEIVGLLVALRLYAKRDFVSELDRWQMCIRKIVNGLDGVQGVQASYVFPGENEKPVPAAHIQIDERVTQLSAHEIINRLEAGDPVISVYETFASNQLIVIFPESLQDGDPEIIIRRFKEVLQGEL